MVYCTIGIDINFIYILCKALLVAPQDSNIIYNIALILQKLGTQTLEDETFNVKNMLQAENELALAFKYD